METAPATRGNNALEQALLTKNINPQQERDVQYAAPASPTSAVAPTSGVDVVRPGGVAFTAHSDAQPTSATTVPTTTVTTGGSPTSPPANVTDGAEIVRPGGVAFVAGGQGTLEEQIAATRDLSVANAEGASEEEEEEVAAAAGRTGQAARAVGNVALQALQVAGGVAVQAYRAATGAVQKAANSDVAHRAADTFKHSADTGYDKSQEVTARAGEATRELASQVYDKSADVANRAAGTFKQSADQSYDSTQEAGARAGEAVRSTANQAYDKTSEVAGNAADRFNQSAAQGYDSTRAQADNVGANVDSAAAEVQSGAADTADSAAATGQGIASRAYNTAAAVAAKAAETARGAANRVYNATRGTAAAGQPTDEGALGPDGKTYVTETLSDTTTTQGVSTDRDFLTANERMGRGAAQGADSAAEQAKAVGGQAYDTAANVASKVAETSKAAASKVYTTVAGVAGQVAEAAKGTAAEANARAPEVDSHTNDAADTTTGTTTSTYHVSEGGHTAPATGPTVAEQARGAAGQAYETAANVASQAADTSKAAAGNMLNAARGAAGAVASGANAALDSTRNFVQQAMGAGEGTKPVDTTTESVVSEASRQQEADRQMAGREGSVGLTEAERQAWWVKADRAGQQQVAPKHLGEGFDELQQQYHQDRLPSGVLPSLARDFAPKQQQPPQLQQQGGTAQFPLDGGVQRAERGEGLVDASGREAKAPAGFEGVGSSGYGGREADREEEFERSLTPPDDAESGPFDGARAPPSSAIFSSNAFSQGLPQPSATSQRDQDVVTPEEMVPGAAVPSTGAGVTAAVSSGVERAMGAAREAATKVVGAAKSAVGAVPGQPEELADDRQLDRTLAGKVPSNQAPEVPGQLQTDYEASSPAVGSGATTDGGVTGAVASGMQRVADAARGAATTVTDMAKHAVGADQTQQQQQPFETAYDTPSTGASTYSTSDTTSAAGAGTATGGGVTGAVASGVQKMTDAARGAATKVTDAAKYAVGADQTSTQQQQPDFEGAPAISRAGDAKVPGEYDEALQGGVFRPTAAASGAHQAQPEFEFGRVEQPQQQAQPLFGQQQQQAQSFGSQIDQQQPMGQQRQSPLSSLLGQMQQPSSGSHAAQQQQPIHGSQVGQQIAQPQSFGSQLGQQAAQPHLPLGQQQGQQTAQPHLGSQWQGLSAQQQQHLRDLDAGRVGHSTGLPHTSQLAGSALPSALQQPQQQQYDQYSQQQQPGDIQRTQQQFGAMHLGQHPDSGVAAEQPEQFPALPQLANPAGHRMQQMPLMGGASASELQGSGPGGVAHNQAGVLSPEGALAARGAEAFRSGGGDQQNVLTLAEAVETTDPAVRIEETEVTYELYVDAPGVKLEDVTVSVSEAKILTIRTMPAAWHAQGGDRFQGAQSAPFEGFEHQYKMESGIDSSKVMANLSDGILKIVVPKMAHKPKIVRTGVAAGKVLHTIPVPPVVQAPIDRPVVTAEQQTAMPTKQVRRVSWAGEAERGVAEPSGPAYGSPAFAGEEVSPLQAHAPVLPRAQ